MEFDDDFMMEVLDNLNPTPVLKKKRKPKNDNTKRKISRTKTDYEEYKKEVCFVFKEMYGLSGSAKIQYINTIMKDSMQN